MARILCLETSTRMCSVALSAPDGTIASRELLSEGFSHAEMLHVFIDEVLKEADWTMHDLDAIAVAKGPGSYTGLRIGISTAKGLAYSLNKRIVCCTSLEVLHAGCLHHNPKAASILTMLDARRMEVYAQLFSAGHSSSEIAAHVVDESSFPDYTDTQVVCTGDGAVKCAEALHHKDWIFEERHPEARHMHALAQQAYAEARFEDVAYLEPFYLKDFIAGRSKRAPLG